MERNKTVVPLLQKLLEIQQERREKGEPNHREQEQQEAVNTINSEDEKLPTMAQLNELNKTISDRILTEIQNGIITRVKQEQTILKKKASNELKEITRKLSNLNQKLENNPTEEERNEILETKELYDSKHTAYFKRETENQTMFRYLILRNLQNGS